ncbi:hypothetical protein MPTK1_2g25490 [Marchantia polymorpha subsp. ruderalis]|uniref:Uncharacterized protein n=1 Tax=Marchantia polymorpha TaxID=3197 RepID=A0A2R6XBI8_MARPO|nr:hypothetical protein MARPO_0025s0129 [Marchantia polymorpha]BBN03685.1 hypothetical protein Mp_2g25490 [Marchantia polymorpha subsp. ruderalis]|eukprot:PTQ43447.1 hypothetical protein MARPO_0025s0129 [Marchantia polymorpha]
MVFPWAVWLLRCKSAFQPRGRIQRVWICLSRRADIYVKDVLSISTWNAHDVLLGEFAWDRKCYITVGESMLLAV